MDADALSQAITDCICFDSAHDSTFTQITDNVFSENSGYLGGGISIGSGESEIIDNTFSENSVNFVGLFDL